MSPTWSSAADWDAATAEDGVGHYSQANTDYSDATKVQQAYDYVSFSEVTPTPISAYPFHEDSGTTANDLSGTNDGTYSGPTLGQTGLLGTTAPSLDGADDEILVNYTELQNFTSSYPFAVSAWVYDRGQTNTTGAIFSNFGSGEGFRLRLFDGNTTTYTPNASFTSNVGEEVYCPDADWSQDTWHHVVYVKTGSDVSNTSLYVDGSDVTQVFFGNSPNAVSGGGSPTIGNHPGSSFYLNGNLADVRIYDAELTASEAQTLYDVVDTPGTLTTDYRSG